MKLPSHTTIAAYGALFVALGGTGYAASTLPRNSVGSAQIRNGSVQSRDLARAARPPSKARIADTVAAVLTDPTSPLSVVVHATDGAVGPIGPQGPKGDVGGTGGQGPKGDTGATGPRGAALGYAHVAADGTIDASHSTPNVVVTRPPAQFNVTGRYCIDATDATVQNVYVNIDFMSGTNGRATELIPSDTDPCGGHDVEVVLTDGSGALANYAFFVTLNG